MNHYIFAGLETTERAHFISSYGDKESVNYLINTMGANMGVTMEQIKSSSRKKYIVTARQVIIYEISKRFSHLSDAQVGSYVDRDRTTVIYSKDQYEALKNDPYFKKRILAALSAIPPLKITKEDINYHKPPKPIKGIYKKHNKWVAIYYEGKKKRELGLFDTKVEAKTAKRLFNKQKRIDKIRNKNPELIGNKYLTNL